MDQFENLQFKKYALKQRRAELIKQIADCADTIKEIDMQLAVVQGCELEQDLIQAEVRP